MTDKTDIAAQLSKRILHYADMASCTSEGTSVLGADLLKLIGDTINDLVGKLEVVSKSEWKLGGELVELQMNYNAIQLKGEQVPVAWIRKRIIDKPEHKGKVWCDISYPAKPEPAVVDGVYHDVIIPLYDRPQKPVVLPEGFYPDGDIDCELVINLSDAIAAIKAAGGIVKDGE